MVGVGKRERGGGGVVVGGRPDRRLFRLKREVVWGREREEEVVQIEERGGVDVGGCVGGDRAGEVGGRAGEGGWIVKEPVREKVKREKVKN